MRQFGLSWWSWIVAVLVVACGGSPGEGLEQTGDNAAALVSGGATAFSFSALPATIQAGATGTFTVRAVDGSGNTATGYVGKVHFTANYPATTFSADYTFAPADQGAHAFQFTPLEAGTQLLYATDTATSSVQGSAALLCVASSATQYSLSNLTNGSPLGAGVVSTFDLTAYDAYWNVATTYDGNAIITSSDPAAILPANPTFTAGVVTGVPITFKTAGGQSVTATDSALSSMTDTAWATINAAPSAKVTAPANATTGSTGLAASVVAQSGATYAWSLTNGAIASGAGTSAVTFSVGSVGTSTVSCVVTGSGGSSTGTATVQVAAAPVTPIITGVTSVGSASTGNTASVTVHAGMTYRWTITGGGITSAGGLVGVTSGGTNSITYTAGAVGTITITAAEINAASLSSAPATLSIASVAAASAPVITAPASTTLGLSFTASSPATSGTTYAWTVNGVAVASAISAGVTSISYTPATVGTLSVVCVGNDGVTSASATRSVSVVAAPVTPVITATSPVTAGQTARTATVVAHTKMTYRWTLSGGTITSAGGTAGVTASGVNKITYTAGPAGTLALTAVELNAALTSSAIATKSVTVVAGAPVAPAITAASTVTTGTTGLTASVIARAGMTYVWTLTGGTITSGGGNSGVTSAGVNTLTYTAGGVGSIVVTCAESNGAKTSAAKSKTIKVVASPVTPTVSVASSVMSTTAGITATVVARAGMTYAWSITNGTLTSATSGVTSTGVNKVTFTSGSVGSLTLSVTEKNTANATSAPGTASVNVTSSAAPPATPTITLASSAVTAGAPSTAHVTARSGMTYTWTIAGGTITSGPAGVTRAGVNTLGFTAGAAGTLSLTCVESNGTTTSAAAGAAMAVVEAPRAPTVTAPASANAGQTSVTASVVAHAGMTYAWALTGGTITSGGGTTGVTSGSTNTLTFTAGNFGTVALTCYEVNSLAAASAPGSASVAITGGAAPTGHVYVVAHQDDDLLFMNPDIEKSIRSGHPTRVVFVTAAGSPDLASWQAREHGVFTPYMMMAQAAYSIYDDSASYWTCGPHPFNGFPVQLCSLTQNPLVSLVFLRLRDGSLSSLWDTDSGAPFYVTPAATLTSADGVNTYTKASLTATVASIFADFPAARVGTLDSTFAYGDDHQDHVTSALLALDATHQWGASVDTRIYRAYSMDGAPDYYTTPAAEAVNLSPTEYTEKHAVMEAYGGGFANGSTFDNWCHRRYAIERIIRGVGPLQESGAGCIDAQGGRTADGTRAIVTACTGSVAQNWTVTPDYQIAGPAGKCLTLGAGGAVELATCTASATQKWTFFANGQVRGQNATCLTDNGDGTLSATFCSADTSANQWQPTAAQKFSQLAGTAFTWSSGTNFSDVDVGALASSYRSLQLFDVDGDGYSDACIRLAGGLYCGTNAHDLLGTYTLFGAGFSDANGWSADGYGSTVQYADVNLDHVLDACARTSTGLACAIGSSTGFAPATAWSSEFSDSTVFVGSSYYRSLHFADINADGYADVCGRTATGVSCALNTKSGAFAASTSWLATDFTDAGGFGADAYGSTIQLGDVDGDGKADVCGRAPTGLFCATSTGTSFVDDHKWSFRTDFADTAGWNAAAGYYGSIHLGDVNGDGLADACGRGINGVVCAYSDAATFEQAIAVQPKAFTDAQGWKPDAYGTSLRIGDVNHDGRGDLCGRSSTGLLCSVMP